VSTAALRALTIEDFGLIRAARVEFADGLCVFSGETGSGKTMLLGSLRFALGDRAAAGIVREGAPKTVVTLELELDDEARAALAEAGYEIDAGEPAIVVRELSAQGKSAARINGRPAAGAVLRDLAQRVVDVVGQHEAQRLLAPARHLDVIDRFAGDGVAALREAVGAAHARCEELAAELALLRHDESKAAAGLEEARAALIDIDGAQPEPGEDERLRVRREFLGEAERIAQTLAAARDELAAGDDGALDRVGRAAAGLARVARYAPALEAIHRQLGDVESLLNEAAAAVAGELESTEFDAGEREAIAERLDRLDRLKRRYGGSIESVLAERAAAAETIERYESRDERSAELRAALDRARQTLAGIAAELSARRRAAAQAMEQRVAVELQALAMPAARFEVLFTPLDPPGAAGAERAEFMLAPNAGEPPRPIARAASGGELSRVLLALVVAGADPQERTTLVFDEIDAGVGGATALAVGERLAALARTHQVICVTHLAQIAAWADAHFTLRKREARSTTTIDVVALAAAPGIETEIARMLSGSASREALDHAAVLLRDARERKIGRVAV
jgi:DNA repair protein RecN (Recombination protein N)